MTRSETTLPPLIRPARAILRAGLTLAVALAGVALPAGPATAGDVVYVESNVATGRGNAILAFRRDAAGKLTMIPGSPFPAGGNGVSPSFNLGPYDSDQEIAVDAEKTLLFAVNGGSDSIAVFHIRRDGGLVPVAGSPFSSEGTNPVSLGISGNILTVVNKDQDPGRPGPSPANYTTFRISEEGELTPVEDSTVAVAAGASPSQALVSPSGRLVFGADFMGGLVRSFALSRRGDLDPRAALRLPASEFADTNAPPFPLGLAVHPRQPYLYVGFVTINRMGVYRYRSNGRLEFVRSVNNSGKGLCWIDPNKAGTRLYTSNTADNSISVYDLEDPAAPVEIQKVTLRGPGEAYQIALDSAGRFLYAVTQKNSATEPDDSNALHVLSVGRDGKLDEVDSSPTVLRVPAGTRPQGVVAP